MEIEQVQDEIISLVANIAGVEIEIAATILGKVAADYLLERQSTLEGLDPKLDEAEVEGEDRDLFLQEFTSALIKRLH